MNSQFVTWNPHTIDIAQATWEKGGWCFWSAWKKGPEFISPAFSSGMCMDFRKENPDKPGNFYICDVVKGHPIVVHISTKFTNRLFPMLLEQY